MGVPKAVVAHLHEFQNTCHFKLAVLHLFKKEIDPHQIEQLREAFEAMDDNKDGKLSYSEFERHMKNLDGVDASKLKMIFDQVDIDEDRTISFHELLASAADHQLTAFDERLYKLFVSLDEN